MELAGLVIGGVTSTTLLVQIARSGKRVCESIKNISEEAESIALRMSMETERTLAIHNLIFGADDVEGQAADKAKRTQRMPPLIETLNQTTQSNVFLVSRQFHQIMGYRFQELQELFSIAQLPANSADDQQPSSAAAKQLGSRKRLSWALWRRRRIQVIVDEYENWNERLFAIVQLHSLAYLVPAAEAASVPKTPLFRTAEEDKSVKLLGLDDEMKLAKISSTSNQVWSSLELPRNDVSLDNLAGRLQCGTINGRDIIVDFKSFMPNMTEGGDEVLDEPTSVTKRRILQLAALLHQRRSNRFRTLPCHGFFRDSTKSRYGFVFDVLPGRVRKPINLLEILIAKPMVKNSDPRPALERRYALSLSLAIALSQFHTVGWVHKSLRSENVLFFPSEASKSGISELRDPYIVGFEFARENPGLSEQAYGDIDIRQELYKHPEQWGQPTRKFQQMHDVYSLGVVLLEIGLWRPVSRLEQNGFQNVHLKERSDVQALLIRQAKDKLPFYAGISFAKVVERCLSGDFESEQSFSVQENASDQEIYQSQVSNPQWQVPPNSLLLYANSQMGRGSAARIERCWCPRTKGSWDALTLIFEITSRKCRRGFNIRILSHSTLKPDVSNSVYQPNILEGKFYFRKPDPFSDQFQG